MVKVSNMATHMKNMSNAEKTNPSMQHFSHSLPCNQVLTVANEIVNHRLDYYKIQRFAKFVNNRINANFCDLNFYDSKYSKMVEKQLKKYQRNANIEQFLKE